MRSRHVLFFVIIIMIIPGMIIAGNCGDVNNSGAINILDVSYLINYLYKEGPAPNCGPQDGYVKDIDGNTYLTVKIGDQWWMGENLKVTHYRNGDPIPNIIDNTEWSNLDSGAYCNFNNDEGNVAIYGRLYNWHTIADNRNIAPEGWHIPSDDEWKQLEIYLGMNPEEAELQYWRGTIEGGKLKEAETTHWNSPNSGATNESGFTALPGGQRYTNGEFPDDGLGNHAIFHTATECYLSGSWYRYLSLDKSGIYRMCGYEKIGGMSIRCIKDIE